MAQFLVLGAGLVARPLAAYLARRNENHITIASHILSEAQSIAAEHENAVPILADVTDEAALGALIGGMDVVISFVPPPMHPLVAKACIKAKVHMVNASYQSPELTALDDATKAAGICILSEIGLDPGIDHLGAMKIIDAVHERGEQVETFISWCGGLPAPQHNDNPLGYKFSWQPKGAILVLLNTAAYLRSGHETVIDGKNLMNWAKPIGIAGLDLECYPNRNSVMYQSIYGIEEADNILRGTLRYQGFCQILQLAKILGLMNTAMSAVPGDMSWRDYIVWLNPDADLEGLKKRTGASWQGLEWLGCFSEQKIAPKPVPIDVFCHLFLEKLSYADHEQDMIVLLHKFVIKKPNGDKYSLSSLLKLEGEIGGHSAMARTVGFPAAIAAQMIADGKIDKTGMIRPVSKDIYVPMLKALKREGIAFKNTRTAGEKQGFTSELI